MKIKTSVYYKDIYLEVDGYYSKGYIGTYEQPPEPEEFQIDRVMYKGVDIIDLLIAIDFDLIEIENLVLEKIKDI